VAMSLLWRQQEPQFPQEENLPFVLALGISGQKEPGNGATLGEKLGDRLLCREEAQVSYVDPVWILHRQVERK